VPPRPQEFWRQCDLHACDLHGRYQLPQPEILSVLGVEVKKQLTKKVKELGGQKSLDDLGVLVWFQSSVATPDGSDGGFDSDPMDVAKQHFFAIPVIEFATMGDIPQGQHWLILTYQDCGNIEGECDLDLEGGSGVAGLRLQFSRLAYSPNDD
jgi:hypothetical protein